MNIWVKNMMDPSNSDRSSDNNTNLMDDNNTKTNK